MFDNRVDFRFRIILLVTLLFLTMTLTGCSRYKTLTNNEGIARFSFEYPGDLKSEDLYRMDKYVTAYFIREIVKDGWFDKDLYIIAAKPPFLDEAGVNDAGTLLEKDISHLYDSFEVARVLERSPVNVSGVQGELVVFTYDLKSSRMLLPDAPLKGTPEGPTLIMVGRCVYFDQGGLVWMIRVTSTEEVAEETKADFEHILETFKVLD